VPKTHAGKKFKIVRDETMGSLSHLAAAMSITHHDALKTFAARLARLLLLRRAVQWLTVWFFIWGAIVLAVRVAGFQQTYWLALRSIKFLRRNCHGE
jgi:hypothetical protein